VAAVAFTVRWRLLLKCVGRIHKWPVAIEIAAIEIHFRCVFEPLLQVVLVVAVVIAILAVALRGLLRRLLSRRRWLRGR
jgi:hypothetical protein